MFSDNPCLNLFQNQTVIIRGIENVLIIKTNNEHELNLHGCTNAFWQHMSSFIPASHTFQSAFEKICTCIKTSKN